MKSLTIKKLPQEVHTALKVMAAQQEITLEAFLNRILSDAAGKKNPSERCK